VNGFARAQRRYHDAAYIPFVDGPGLIVDNVFPVCCWDAKY
jgi:hypothetical protein